MTNNNVIHGLELGQIQAIVGNQALFIESLQLKIVNLEAEIKALKEAMIEMENDKKSENTEKVVSIKH